MSFRVSLFVHPEGKVSRLEAGKKSLFLVIERGHVNKALGFSAMGSANDIEVRYYTERYQRDTGFKRRAVVLVVRAVVVAGIVVSARAVVSTTAVANIDAFPTTEALDSAFIGVIFEGLRRAH